MSEFRGTVLTGEELVRRRFKNDPIFPVRGPKQFYPSGSWIEGKQLQSLLDATKDFLAEERVERESALSRAEWDENLKIARVTRLVGHQFEKFGHEEDTTVFLYPEEALHLLETNHLEILYGGVSMSIQQAYMTLLNPKVGCTFLEYIVFSHLLKNGFKVLRHCPKRTVTRYERLIGLHPGRSKTKKCDGKNRKVLKDPCSDINDKIKEEDNVKDINVKKVSSSVLRDKRLKRSKDFKEDSESGPLAEDISCVEVTVEGNSSSFSDIEILSEKSVNDIKSEDDLEFDDDSSFSLSDDSDCQVVFSKGAGNKDYSCGTNSIEEINLSDSDESVECNKNNSNVIKIELPKLEPTHHSEVPENNIPKEEQNNASSGFICEISQGEGKCIQEDGLKEIKETSNVSMNSCKEQFLFDNSELSMLKNEDKNLSLVNNVNISEIVENTRTLESFSNDSLVKEECGYQNSDSLIEKSVSSRKENSNPEEMNKPAKDQDKIEIIDLAEEPKRTEDRWAILDSFPNAAGFHTVHCTVPPPHLCPPEVKPSQTTYVIVLERLKDPRFGGSQKRQKANSKSTVENDDLRHQRSGYCRNVPYRHSNRHSRRPFNRRFHPRHRFRGHQHRGHGHGHQHSHNHQVDRFPSNSCSPNSLMYPPMQCTSTPHREQGSFPFCSEQWQSPYEHNRYSPRWRDHSSDVLDQHSVDHGFQFRGAQMQRYPRRRSRGGRTSFDHNRNNEHGAEELNFEEGSFIPIILNNSTELTSHQQTSRPQMYKRRKDTSEETSNHLCSRGKYPRRGRERSFGSGRFFNNLSEFMHSVNNEEQNISVQSSEYNCSRSGSDVQAQPRNSNTEDFSSSDSHTSDDSSYSESSDDSSDESMHETDKHGSENINVLLKAEDLKDIDDALKSLQLVKSAKLQGLSAAPDEPLLSIKFDLYLPSTHFRKSEPSLPDFRVIVMSPDQTLPSSRQLAFLEEGFDDDVPLLFAIASPDTVAFFLHSSVHFPQISSKEKVQT